MRKFVVSIAIVVFGIVLLASCDEVLPTMPAPTPPPPLPPEITSFLASRYTLPKPGDPTALSWKVSATGLFTLELKDNVGNSIFKETTNDSSRLSALQVVNPSTSRNYILTVTMSEGVASKQLRITVQQPSTTPSPPPPSNNPAPTPRPPSGISTLVFNITDQCNDGYRINYKFFDRTNNLVWPGQGKVYYTEYYNQTYTHRLSCKTGAKICYGGNTGNSYWGIGKDGDKGCTNCCFTCQGGEVSRRLTC